jgi:hypothetical protein
MILRYFATLGLTAVMLTGCITSTSQMRLAEDRAILTTRGNAYTSPEHVQRELFVQAAKLAQASGFEWFVIEDSRDVTQNSFLMTPASGSASAAGNASGWAGNANYRGASVIPLSKPGTSVSVRFGRGEKPANALDAAFILAQNAK